MISIILFALIILIINTLLFSIAIVIAQHYRWLPKNSKKNPTRQERLDFGGSIFLVANNGVLTLSHLRLSTKNDSIHCLRSKSDQTMLHQLSVEKAWSEGTQSSTTYWPELQNTVPA